VIDYNSTLTEEFLRTGTCTDCPVIDMHAHMFNTCCGTMLPSTPELQVSSMDKSGVELALFCSHDALYEGFPAFQKDVDAARKFPDRLKVYQVVYSPDCDWGRDLAFSQTNPEIIGWKFHGDTYKIPIDDPIHNPYWEYADQHKMPVLVHTWNNSVWSGPSPARKVLEKWHNMPFIAGHSFRGQVQEAIRLAQEYPNLWLELTAVLSQRGMVEEFVDAGLEDRILFGVDAPWFSYSFAIGALLSAEISDDVRKKILYKNAVRLLQYSGIVLPQSLNRIL